METGNEIIFLCVWRATVAVHNWGDTIIFKTCREFEGRLLEQQNLTLTFYMQRKEKNKELVENALIQLMI